MPAKMNSLRRTKSWPPSEDGGGCEDEEGDQIFVQILLNLVTQIPKLSSGSLKNLYLEKYKESLGKT